MISSGRKKTRQKKTDDNVTKINDALSSKEDDLKGLIFRVNSNPLDLVKKLNETQKKPRGFEA